MGGNSDDTGGATNFRRYNKCFMEKVILKTDQAAPLGRLCSAEGVTEQLGTKVQLGQRLRSVRGQDAVLTEGWRGEPRDFGRNGCQQACKALR